MTKAEQALLRFVFHDGLPKGPFAKLLNGDKKTREKLPTWASRFDVLRIRADLSDEINAKVSDEEILALLIKLPASAA